MPSITSSMNLKIPLAGETDYSTSVSDSLTAIDDHDHSSGNGSQIVTAGIADLAVTSAKLAADSVTTTKILAANVTRAKLEAVGQQISSSCGTVAVSSLTPADITNLTVTLTTTGRPVVLAIVADGTTSTASFNSFAGGATNTTSMIIYLMEGATVIANFELDHQGSTNHVHRWPGSIYHIFVPSAGAHTYKVQAAGLVSAGQSYSITNVKFVAFEL